MTATATELTAALDHLRAAPAAEGTLALVVRRPAVDQREILAEGRLDPADGLVGDNWLSRATSHAIAEGRHLEAQLNVMSARMVALLAERPEEQALAGDQLFVDLDISHTNLPTGTRLAIGDPDAGGAVIEVTKKPHNGCAKFRARFGDDAVAFVNSEEGKELRLRGFNARVVQPGSVRPGDPVRKL
ncbi:MOSC domain-containing protein [Nocardioides sp.]|uniref:MOSC domain-containing protein n=1 Tax=Nocardioides sp. TaxID=35761 RepID=UPI0035281865